MYASGTSLARFPQSNSNFLIYRELNDQGEAFLADAANKTLSKTKIESVPILGLAQMKLNENEEESQAGRVVVYGDSNCIDSSHMKKDCFWLLSALIEYASHDLLYSGFKESTSENFIPITDLLPQRIQESNLKNYSKTIGTNRLLECEKINFETENLIKTVPIQDLPHEK